jgi:phosphatidylserine/phosphatidylglycerophosphate/cardiolipin synthase-like enzyme
MGDLILGETCWRKERADRIAFLIDTQAYFRALHEALQKATRSILILGWAFDPRTKLLPNGHSNADEPGEIGHMLLRLARQRPDLDIRILIWKSALPVSVTQDFFPQRARSWFRDSSIQFHLDDKVPIGACHHQKVVVVDDRLAFCGSGDICVDRWDTQRHLEHDQRRIMPDQECHDARHEVMVMLDGDAARALGEHFRDRWRIGVGGEIAPPTDGGGDPWPETMSAHLCGARVGLARTKPDWRDQKGVQEINRLALCGIASARSTIYLENQYFASPIVAAALARRLGEPDGPEVILISTGQSPSWFDQLTMDNARGAMIRRLRAADVHGRFRAYYPVTSVGSMIVVHSKTSIFDDRLARVGSANLNNRSFGFDTEIEVALEAVDDPERQVVGAFRNQLLGHFLGCPGAAVGAAAAELGGLIPAIDQLNTNSRLKPIKPSRRSSLESFVAEFHLGDPSTPADSWRPWRRRRRLYGAIQRPGIVRP